MTRAHFDRSEIINGLRIEGHQEGAPAGENLYCAAVSAIACTLLNALQAEKLMVEAKWERKDGLMLITCMRTPRTDAMFDMAKRGLEAMAAKWPDRVTVDK